MRQSRQYIIKEIVVGAVIIAGMLTAALLTERLQSFKRIAWASIVIAIVINVIWSYALHRKKNT
jgi:uncharacterized membrane protein YadS